MDFASVRKPFIIGEIGINHNGDVELAKKMISMVKECGGDAVKFQKRDVEKVYTKEELDKYRESPWGTTNREQKMGLEFGPIEYDEIDRYCEELNIPWFASAWDLGSQKFLQQYDLPFNKIASAMLTYDDLLEMVAKEGKHTFISTGMSTLDQVDHAVEIFDKHRCSYTVMHCTSTYPCSIDEVNLKCIPMLAEKYKNSVGVGFSGHTVGILPTVLAVNQGACVAEVHVTVAGGRSLYGSDQRSSIEPPGFRRLCRDCRDVERILGTGEKVVYDSEKPIIEKLRKY